MAGETMVTVIGNVVEDPDMRFLPNGTAVLTLKVISNSRYYNKNSGQWEEGNSFVAHCEVWRQQADNVVESVKKGTRVIVQGALNLRRFETKDGGTGTILEIKQAEVAVSLRFAKAQVEKVTGSSQSYDSNQGGQSYSSSYDGSQQGGYASQGGYQQSGQQFNKSGGAGSRNADDAWATQADSAFDQPPPF